MPIARPKEVPIASSSWPARRSVATRLLLSTKPVVRCTSFSPAGVLPRARLGKKHWRAVPRSAAKQGAGFSSMHTRTLRSLHGDAQRERALPPRGSSSHDRNGQDPKQDPLQRTPRQPQWRRHLNRRKNFPRKSRKNLNPTSSARDIGGSAHREAYCKAQLRSATTYLPTFVPKTVTRAEIGRAHV